MSKAYHTEDFVFGGFLSRVSAVMAAEARRTPHEFAVDSPQAFRQFATLKTLQSQIDASAHALLDNIACILRRSPEVVGWSRSQTFKLSPSFLLSRRPHSPAQASYRCHSASETDLQGPVPQQKENSLLIVLHLQCGTAEVSLHAERRS